jgi:hypothetical protein
MCWMIRCICWMWMDGVLVSPRNREKKEYNLQSPCRMKNAPDDDTVYQIISLSVVCLSQKPELTSTLLKGIPIPSKSSFASRIFNIITNSSLYIIRFLYYWGPRSRLICKPFHSIVSWAYAGSQRKTLAQCLESRVRIKIILTVTINRYQGIRV